MITVQHTAIYYLALYSARNAAYSGDRAGFKMEFKHELPFVLLSDGIRAYSKNRQTSHFEETPDGTDVSWMKFPDEKTLKTLTADNFLANTVFWLAPGYPKCVIGEKTCIDEFDRRNFGHKHYHALRIHLFQDAVLDDVLRKELIDPSQRFRDEFTVRHNKSMKINGQELRRQVAEFERIGFIKLAGIVFENTGALMNNEWFERNVYPALCAVYSQELADNTFKYMRLDEETDARITRHEFAITDADKALVPMAHDLDGILTEMYADAYYYTRREL